MNKVRSSAAPPANPETKKGRHEAGPLEWGGGGDEEDRTPDLGIANAALSQLSYVPTNVWMIPPLRSIPNRRARSQQDERPWRCGKRNTPAAMPVLAMRPPLRKQGHPVSRMALAGSGKVRRHSDAPSPLMPRIALGQ